MAYGEDVEGVVVKWRRLTIKAPGHGQKAVDALAFELGWRLIEADLVECREDDDNSWLEFAFLVPCQDEKETLN